VVVHLRYARIFIQIEIKFYHYGSLGARVGEVQVHQTRQFNSNMLEFFLIGINYYHYGQFNNASDISSDAANMAVHLEHATIFI
jgi:hypothetical protein